MVNLSDDDLSVEDSSEFDEKTSSEITSLAEELDVRYRKLVYYFLRIFDLPNDRLEDLYNQIFVKILGGLGRIKHMSNLKSWIVTITKNEAYNYLNKQNRELKIYRTMEESYSFYDDISQKASPDPDPEQQILYKQLLDVFNKCISRMDEKIRAPFIMRYRENMKWAEIGKALNLNEDTARKRADKAKKITQSFLKKHLQSR